ncbi:TPA: hypothetical protein PPJ19_001391 [Escherichia coli]|nr:hypothetical protein [Escherichia coli]
MNTSYLTTPVMRPKSPHIIMIVNQHKRFSSVANRIAINDMNVISTPNSEDVVIA